MEFDGNEDRWRKRSWITFQPCASSTSITNLNWVWIRSIPLGPHAYFTTSKDGANRGITTWALASTYDKAVALLWNSTFPHELWDNQSACTSITTCAFGSWVRLRRNYITELTACCHFSKSPHTTLFHIPRCAFCWWLLCTGLMLNPLGGAGALRRDARRMEWSGWLGKFRCSAQGSLYVKSGTRVYDYSAEVLFKM